MQRACLGLEPIRGRVRCRSAGAASPAAPSCRDVAVRRRRGRRRGRRGQHLHDARAGADPAAARHLHQRDRDQDEHRLRRERHRRAAGGGRRELARRHHHGRRLRHADRHGEARPDASRCIPTCSTRRCRRTCAGRTGVVRDVDARPRHLRLEGAGRGGRHDLRGSRRPEMEGPRLHPLRPASL